MKKTISFVLTAITAVGFSGWGMLSAHAITTYTAQQVAQHNTSSNCWLIISGQVYDVTNFIPIHPGGNAIVPYCGADASSVFDSVHNAAAFALLPTYLIGSVGTAGTALTAPTNLAGAPAQTSVALTWTGSTGGVASVTYTVKRGGVSVGTTTSTAFTDAGLTPGTTYTFTVQATDSATPTANTTSSSQISVTTLKGSQTGGGDQENENENEHISTSTAQTGENEHENVHISTSTSQTGGGEGHSHQNGHSYNGD